jgi:hypothetical protein
MWARSVSKDDLRRGMARMLAYGILVSRHDHGPGRLADHAAEAAFPARFSVTAGASLDVDEPDAISCDGLAATAGRRGTDHLERLHHGHWNF